MEHLVTPPPEDKIPKAATRIYDRNPEWKFHSDLGKAKNALLIGSPWGTQYTKVVVDGVIKTAHTVRSGEIWIPGVGGWQLYFYSTDEDPILTVEVPWRNDGTIKRYRRY